MHKCSIKCCESTSMPSDSFQRCLDLCNNSLVRCGNLMQKEIKAFQVGKGQGPFDLLTFT